MGSMQAVACSDEAYSGEIDGATYGVLDPQESLLAIDAVLAVLLRLPPLTLLMSDATKLFARSGWPSE